MSTAGKIVPASPVNIIGTVKGDASRLKDVMVAGRIVDEASASFLFDLHVGLC